MKPDPASSSSSHCREVARALEVGCSGYMQQYCFPSRPLGVHKGTGADSGEATSSLVCPKASNMSIQSTSLACFNSVTVPWDPWQAMHCEEIQTWSHHTNLDCTKNYFPLIMLVSNGSFLRNHPFCVGTDRLSQYRGPGEGKGQEIKDQLMHSLVMLILVIWQGKEMVGKTARDYMKLIVCVVCCTLPSIQHKCSEP